MTKGKPTSEKQSCLEDENPVLALPQIVRRMGEALVGSGCGGLEQRLIRAARASREGKRSFPKIATAGAELAAIAEALGRGERPPRPETLLDLCRVPVIRQVVSRIPVAHRSNFRLLANSVEEAGGALRRFHAALWLDGVGGRRAGDLVNVLMDDEEMAIDVAAVSGQACRIADAELMRAGLTLITVARQMEMLLGFFMLGICEDDCVEGAVRNCKATKVTFVPYGRDVDDVKDFQNALLWLKVFSYVTPGKVLSPGGKGLIRKAISGLAKIKKIYDKKFIQLDGYAVFVVLEYEKCVKGFCGTYWAEKTAIVQIDPPRLKRHRLRSTKTGWKKRLIENLGKKGAKASVIKRQFREFKTLAEKKCKTL